MYLFLIKRNGKTTLREKKVVLSWNNMHTFTSGNLYDNQ